MTPTLFGDWMVLRERGRHRSPGTLRLTRYREQAAAETAQQRTIKSRLRRGYTLREAAT